MPDIMQAARRLSQAIQLPTVSHSDPALMDMAAFDAFGAFLADAFPLVHRQLEKAVVNGHGLVYRWKGSSGLAPVLLTAHYDVVPAEDGGWPYPPFSGEIADGYVFGRGSLDDKGSLMAILEAVTALLQEGFVPRRDVYLAFGFDEEVGGARGAQQIAAHFQQQGLLFDHVLDEGGAVADGAMMGIAKPVAVIGVAEKGNTSFRLTFTGEEGHSSAPPAHTAVSRMAELVHRAGKSPPRPRLTDTVCDMLRAIAPHKPGIAGRLMARPRQFAPLLMGTMLKSRQTAAMLRTTQAFTMASGGSAHNVLPQTASCTVNLRLLQGDSVQSALQRLRSHGIPFEAQAIQQAEPTRASDTASPAYLHLTDCIARIFPDAVPTPYLMTGGTDCRHYEQVVKNSYRFLPARANEEELARIHGRGERLSLDNLRDMIAFYTLYLRSLPG